MKSELHEVSVIARFGTDGSIIPLSVQFEDGHRCTVDRVLDIRPAASRKHGGAGIRYLCVVCGQQLILFMDQNKWFHE